MLKLSSNVNECKPLGGGGGSGGGDGLTARHVLLPPSYLTPNWPLRHVAMSADGQDVAAAGSRGVILHNLRTGKWRVFGRALLFSTSQYECTL